MKKIGVVFFTLLLASSLLPVPVFAGTCVCNGNDLVVASRGAITRIPIVDECIRQDSNRNLGRNPITSEADCQKISSDGYTGHEVACVFDQSDNCETVTRCGALPCYRINASCTSDSACSQYMYQESNTPAASDKDPLGVCKNNLCYVDSTSYQRFINNPSLTSLNGELQLVKPRFQIRIPGISFQDFQSGVDEEGFVHIPYVAEFMTTAYRFAMLVGSVIAVVMIIVQGLRIATSGGGDGQVQGYHRVGQIIVGLIILWGSYAILYTLNPDLVNFRVLKVKFVEPVPIIDVIEEQVVELPASFGTGSPSAGKVPNYKQFDKKWGDFQYGTESICTTIAAAGCGPTSLAEVLTAYGTVVTPDQTAAWMGIPGHGRICNKGTSMGETLDTEKFAGSPWGDNFFGKKVTQDQAIGYLQQGKPIIFLCKSCTGTGQKGPKSYGGHYMVLTGIDGNGNITVNDPGANESKAILVMTPDQLKANGGFWYVAPKGSN